MLIWSSDIAGTGAGGELRSIGTEWLSMPMVRP